jgi:integrase
MKYNLRQINTQAQDQSEAAINFLSYVNKKRFKYALGISVPVHGWDKKKQRAKNGSSHMQPEIEAAVNRIIEVNNQMEKEGVLVTPQSLRSRLEMKEAEVQEVVLDNLVEDNAMGFSQWVEQYINDCASGDERQPNGKKITLRTIQKYRTVQSQLQDFAVKVWGKKIRWKDIDSSFLGKYKSYRANQGLAINTIGKDQAVLKFWIKTAYNREVHDNKKWREKVWQKQEMKIKKPALTEAELKTLREAQMSRDSLNVCRDLFLVSCWTGARVSDLKRMPEIIKDAWNQNGESCPSALCFVQSKTGNSVMVPVLPELRTIIEKWKGDLPALPAEQKMNKRIKEVGQEAGLDRIVELVSTKANEQGVIHKFPFHQMLTNHTGRRTFATLLYKKGIMSNGQLMSLTGHSSETAFLRYLDITTEEISEVAMKIALKAFS